LTFSLFLFPSTRAQAQCTFTNGDFETGTMTGWTVHTRTIGTANWYNYTGTLSPQTNHPISAPPQGTRAAVTDHSDQTTHALFQDFTLPAGQSGTLSFYVAYNNTLSNFITLNTLDYAGNQHARIDLIKTTAGNESIAASDVYVKLFQTKPGDPLTMTPTLMTYDVSGFAGVTTRLRFAAAVGISWLQFAVDNVCLSTTRTTITRPTAVGTNVRPDFGGVNITFRSVIAAGTTSLQQLDPATAQVGAPPGDTFIGPAYDLSTTATVTPPITVCMYLPSITNNTTFSHLRMLHKELGVWVDVPTSRVDLNSRQLCGDVISLSPFTAAVSLLPTAADSAISGAISSADGTPLAGATVNLTGTQSRKTITDANGNYRFDDVETNGFYTVTPSRANYSFGPASRSFSQLGNTTEAVFTGTLDGNTVGNIIDTPEYFVRQHYLDFLGREPEEAGFNFWSDQILSCGADAACIERRAINVSAAYFLSIEFQQTGALVDGLYRASFGRAPHYAEFMPDTGTIARGVVVGINDWQAKLATNKSEFIEAFVNRAEFHAAYDGLSSNDFVNALISHTGVNFGNAERAALVSGLSDGTMTRAVVLQRIAENQQFAQAKHNETFVMMEYFGYLRRDPDADGYQFWLNKLNQFDGNFEQAEMVKAFINSGEYRARFPR
jgi:hypothetical protein